MQDYRLLISKSTGGEKGGIAFVVMARCPVDLATLMPVGLQRILRTRVTMPRPSRSASLHLFKNNHVFNQQTLKVQTWTKNSCQLKYQHFPSSFFIEQEKKHYLILALSFKTTMGTRDPLVAVLRGPSCALLRKVQDWATKKQTHNFRRGHVADTMV